MIEPKIFPPMSKDLHDRLIHESTNTPEGNIAFRTLMVISTRPKTFEVTLFPAATGNRSKAEFGEN